MVSTIVHQFVAEANRAAFSVGGVKKKKQKKKRQRRKKQEDEKDRPLFSRTILVDAEMRPAVISRKK